jgi:hypothetical protein
MSLERGDGTWTVAGSWYGLAGTDGGTVARLDDLDGARWAELRLIAGVDRLDAIDETLAVDGPAIEPLAGGCHRLTWHLASSAWSAARLVIETDDEGLMAHAEVDGSGRVGQVTLLGGRAVLARTNGRVWSGAWFDSVVSGGPADPGRIVRSATESADIGVVSGSEPGRGDWFFTPGPFVYAAARAAAGDGVAMPPGPWLWFGLEALAGELGFPSFGYRASDRGFAFVVDFEGKTAVDGTWRSPAIRIGRAADPYAAVARWRERLEVSGLAPRPERRAEPSWWREPIVCGWGEQGRLARKAGLPLAAMARFSTQETYDGILAVLAAHGIAPGTIVIDDRWAVAYGTCAPDLVKWPDLAVWIAGRHEAGQHVLLWYKAWDSEGLDPDACVRSTAGVPLGIDPTNPDGERAIRAAIRRMLAPPPEGLGADGLKVDFTHRTPAGVATELHGGAWGIDLLRRLFDVVADEARTVQPEALLVGHAPNPLLAPALDMLRLNDQLRLDDPRPIVDIVSQMRHRAALVRAACPGVPIDTDDWCAPGIDGWRAWTAAKIDEGVPALYYATGLDWSGEPFEERDYALIRETWAAYGASNARRADLSGDA